MNFIEASILILGIAILSVPLANRARIPLEIFLFLASCLVSLIPGLPPIQLNPIIVFDLFLPPILFFAAYFTSWHDFKFNLRPIMLLAFGLVTCTALVVAITIKWLIPDFPWAEAFLLGAIVSPTDASAATAIIKKMGAFRRIIVVLEGESLINDASALMIYKFSLIAILYGTFSWGNAVTQLGILTFGGIIVGGVIGVSTIYIVKKLRDLDAETTFTFIAAFASYLIAERLGFSGVISTVSTGIYVGIKIPEIASSNMRVNAKAAWRTMLFIINGFVFTLIGFQLPTVIKNIAIYPIKNLILYGGGISSVVILIRLAWIYPAALLPRLLFPWVARRDPMPSWQMLFAIGWSGMRGIISLAAVLALPTQNRGSLFTHLDLLIFITYCVIVTTLIIPTFTFPFLIKKLNLSETKNSVHEETIARMRTIEEVERILTEMKDVKIPEKVLSEFLAQIKRRHKIVKTQLKETPYSLLPVEFLALKKLTLKAIKAERETLIRLRNTAEIHDEIFRLLSDELDLEELRAKSLRV